MINFENSCRQKYCSTIKNINELRFCSLKWAHLFGQIVVDDKGVTAAVSEELSHGASRVRCQVLQRGSVGGSGANNDGVLQCISVVETLDQLGNGRSLLTDGHVNAVQLLLLVGGLVETLLVDDRVNGDGGLSVNNKEHKSDITKCPTKKPIKFYKH